MASKWHRAIGRSDTPEQVAERKARHAALEQAKREAAERFGAECSEARAEWINARQRELHPER
jgi:hypothetical protein